MEDPKIKAAKMICKSIDALRKEMHMLRMDMLHGKELKEQMKDLDESGFPGKSAGEQRLSRPDENRGITA